MKTEYSGWGGVRTLAKKLGYSWFDVCDILWKTKHHKQPKFKEILIFSIIRRNLIRIKFGKHLRDVCGNLVIRREGEQDTHYAIRADLDLFKNNHIIKKQWKNDPDFYKSIRQKYENLYKQPKFKEILIFSVIRKNLIRIKSGKPLRDVRGNLVRRRAAEQDTHYAIRADLDLFKKNHIIKKQWKNDPDFYKSIRQKYENLYKRFPKEINKQAGMIG